VRAFHVTLHGLRRALQPELARDMSRSVVLADGESYRVVLDEGASWDAAEFLALARDPAGAEEPDSRLRRLRAAEAAYAGPLYPEWPYAEWGLPRRSEVERASQTVLEQLAEALVTAGQPHAASVLYQRLLILDPEREAVHRRLMQTYAQAGERTLALRQYHACRAVLRRELGVEASVETRALYEDLLNG
jgi:DNA-binding SARP family transcriptional activator